MKIALVVGATGQSGSILCELLLERGFHVSASHRRTSVDNLSRIEHIRDQLQLHRLDITDPVSVATVIRDVQPSYVFQMADQDHVGWSMAMPGVSFDVTAKGVLNVLDAVRMHCPDARVFQPVSATMFGMSPPPQHEDTPFDPQSPYAICKLASYHICRHYRKRYGMFISCGIMYNHDSIRRHGDYLLHAIARQAVAIERGEQQRIKLGGHPNTRVDVGCAREFMHAVTDMMQLDKPDDFVIGTGIGHHLTHMVRYALAVIHQRVEHGNEYDRDENYDRPGEQPTLIADIEKARIGFGFNPKRDSLQVLKELIDFYRGRQ